MSTSSQICASTLLLVVVCALAGSREAPEHTSVVPSVIARSSTNEGLTLAEQADHIEGTFTQGETTIHYEIDRNGSRRSALISANDGSPLLASSAEPGHETVTLFGGRTIISGDPHSPEPSVEGELDTLEQLKAMPEGVCIGTLHQALEDAGVDPVLLGAAPADDLATSGSDRQDSSRDLAPNEVLLVGSWGWLTYTRIVMQIGPSLRGPRAGHGCIRLRAGPGGWDHVCGPTGTERLQTRQIWGSLLLVENCYEDVVASISVD